MDECWDGVSAKPQSPLPLCERCGKVRATTSLNFSYRDEEYAVHYYCAPCCDIAWDEGVAYVDAQAAKLAAVAEERQ